MQLEPMPNTFELNEPAFFQRIKLRCDVLTGYADYACPVLMGNREHYTLEPVPVVEYQKQIHQPV